MTLHQLGADGKLSMKRRATARDCFPAKPLISSCNVCQKVYLTFLGETRGTDAIPWVQVIQVMQVLQVMQMIQVLQTVRLLLRDCRATLQLQVPTSSRCPA